MEKRQNLENVLGLWHLDGHGTGSFDGETLIFKINGELCGDTANWESGQASVLNLSID